jgi:hypothetical protein
MLAPFEQRGARPPGQGHAQHHEGYAVVGRVAQEVDGVGQKRHRARLHARGNLDGEHGGVDDQRPPQDAAVARVVGVQVAGAVTVMMAMCGHVFSSFRWHHWKP